MPANDLIIVGAGPAGLTAAIYAGRSRMKTILIEMMMPGGWMALTDVLENYPGVGTVHGVELAQRMAEQAKAFGAETVSGVVSAVDATGDGFEVTVGGRKHAGRAVIVASGTDYRKLGVPGEAELAGRGVSYCATCDGPFYRDKEIAVVGGGDSALQEALYLTTFASKIYLIHRRDEFRQDRMSLLPRRRADQRDGRRRLGRRSIDEGRSGSDASGRRGVPVRRPGSQNGVPPGDGGDRRERLHSDGPADEDEREGAPRGRRLPLEASEADLHGRRGRRDGGVRGEAVS
jgi:pyruvate/2-oxoglutarate dehydrogenase complex dihydrolipoamide dehydrogenase (E3) component